MAKFKYKAIRENGKTYEGVVEATDRFVVYSQIRKEKGTVISVKEASKRMPLSMEAINNLFSTVKASEKIVFTRNLAAMINAGLSLTRALNVLERQSKNAKLKKIINTILEDIKKGQNLHTAMERFPKVFSHLFTSMVKAGEESGKLVEALQNIGDQMKRSYALNRRIRGALTYPVIIIIAMFIIGILMMIYVVPTLTQTFEELGADLPKSTQAIISISNFLTNHTFTALLIFVIVATLITAWFRTAQGKRMFDFSILHIPIIEELVKETNSARTTRTLSSLLSSGVEVVTALAITGEVMQNSYYKEVLQKAEKSIQKGEPISKAFIENEKLYPVLVGEMISVGEETGKLSDMLKDIADFYEEEVEEKTKNLSTIIEPVLMIFIGAVVGFFALAMITPIYSISESI